MRGARMPGAPARARRRVRAARVLLGLALAVLAATGARNAAALTPPEESSHRFPDAALDVPYVPTRMDTVDAMLRLAAVGPKDVVYDLGCGDGRIVIAAAKQYGARGVGVDIDPARIAEARENARRAGVGARTSFVQGDLFHAEIRDATVVMLYLLPSVNERLKPRLLAELAPGTRVVSHDFLMGEDWPPEKTVRLGRDTIYLWTVPARREGGRN
ncbi:MAG: methyltransferase domain-containing protein [Burkholderiales bacterium]|nr:methyltransferase domain-containing protein [Burkholderiales bacterium]